MVRYLHKYEKNKFCSCVCTWYSYYYYFFVVSVSCIKKLTPGEPKLLSKNTSVDLRVRLNTLEREHVDLIAAAMRSVYDERPDRDAALKQLDENSTILVDAVGEVYNKGVQDKFLAILRANNTFFISYALAVKNTKPEDQKKAGKNLDDYVAATTNFFLEQNPGLSRESVQPLFVEYAKHMRSIVDFYANGDYRASYQAQHAAGNQINDVTNTILEVATQEGQKKLLE